VSLRYSSVKRRSLLPWHSPAQRAAARIVLNAARGKLMMLERSWKWVRAVGSACVLGCILSVACSDSEGNGGIAGSGGGGTSGSGGQSQGGSGGNGTGGTSGSGGEDAGTSECRCGGLSNCPSTLAELCADLPEGCPARLETWLTCAERGEIVDRDDVGGPFERVGELYLKECAGYRIVNRQANYIGSRRWIYDEQGRLAAVENVDDTNSGPICGVDMPNDCRFGGSGEPLTRPAAPDAGSDAGALDDAGVINDAGTGADTDAASGDGGSAFDCSRL
jgi:hypothetical protein